MTASSRSAAAMRLATVVLVALAWVTPATAQSGGRESGKSAPNSRTTTGRSLDPAGVVREAVIRPFTPVAVASNATILRFDALAIRGAAQMTRKVVMQQFPLSANRFVDLELEPFRIVAPNAKFVIGHKGEPDTPLSFDPSSVSLFHGHVRGHPGSHVYLSITPNSSTGYIDLGAGAPRYRISARSELGDTLDDGLVSVFKTSGGPSAPAGVPLCGVEGNKLILKGKLVDSPVAPVATTAAASTSTVGLKHLELAVDTDYEYFILFNDEAAAATYLLQMYGEVSAIYMRDVNVRIELVFARLWPDPNDEFNGGDPLTDFFTFWEANMSSVQRDAAQLFSGRRDYPFGGQAFLSQLCNFAYGIVGYAVGFFPNPTSPSPFNYDIPVTAHELGHTSGTGHTHDFGLDTCDNPNTTPRRGPIMSYCGQTWSGMNANTDNYFHTFVRGRINAHVAVSACIVDDCNMNSIDDAIDISTGASNDVNGNGTPDECEDCNGNGTLDPMDIAGASLDLNFNGIPDECEPDCQPNGIPDDKDIADGTSQDLYGDGIPDECEADCNGNSVSDYSEIQLNMPLDVDRDVVLDSCQDCDNDGTTDHVALNASHNIWIASGLDNSIVREFFADTGVLTQASGGIGSSLVREGQDVIVAPNGHVLVSSALDNRVMDFDQSGNYLSDLVTPGSGGLNYPTGMLVTPSGQLLVASRNTNSVLAYDVSTGTPAGAFIPAGSGGLSQPFGLTVGPNGNLYVTSASNEVIEYDVATGSLVGTFVTAADNGGLDQPRGLTFKRDGNLLVASFGTDEVLEFDGATGAAMGKWAFVGTATRITQDSPWGIRVGPNGHVYVSRTGTPFSSPASSNNDVAESHLTDARMFVYDGCTGDFRRTHIGGMDHGLFFATGFDFVPGFEIDCNLNQIPDTCDIDTGTSADANLDGTPDECQIDCNSNGVSDDRDFIPNGTSIDCNCNSIPDECDIASGTSFDCEGNGVPDECESDCNGNGMGDACDVGTGGSPDCNSNNVPDECEPDTDCNNNGAADICDIADGTSFDCNSNGVPDTCDASGGGLIFAVDFESGLPAGWTTSGLFQVTSGCAVNPVCDGNTWAYAGNVGTCSYGNNQVDTLSSPPIALPPTIATLTYCSMLNTEAGFDFASVLVNGMVVASEAGAIGAWEDRTIDLTPFAGQTVTITFRLVTDPGVTAFGWQVDNIALTSGSEDCDGNQVPDECDPDCDGDGIPDGCDDPTQCVCSVAGPALPELVQDAGGSMVPSSKNRFLSFTAGDVGQNAAIRIRFVSMPAPYASWTGATMWLRAPSLASENGGSAQPIAGFDNFRIARLTCDAASAHHADWVQFGMIHVTHEGIIPGGVYEVQVLNDACTSGAESDYSPPLTITNAAWGDAVGTYDADTGAWIAPDSSIDIVTDAVSLLQKFGSSSTAPIKARVDLEPRDVDLVIDISDVTFLLEAFGGRGYPFLPSAVDPCVP